MFEDDRDEKIYNLIITNGFDKNNEFAQFKDKLYSIRFFIVSCKIK